MKLYYSPGACSFSPHIVLEELEIPHQLAKVDLTTHKTDMTVDYYAINPKGYVPALELDNGDMLTEGGAIIQYLADLKPEKNLIPKVGTFERYQLQEWLFFISTEIHKNFSLLWDKTFAEPLGTVITDKILKRLAYVEDMLTNKDFLMGRDFSVADAYFFTIVSWCDYFKIDLAEYPRLRAYMERIRQRPAVQRAKQAEA